MANFEIEPGESLLFQYDPPGETGKTLVFVNALTGNTDMWQGAIAPAARAAGFGTLCYNFRGQAGTSFGDATDLTPELIVQDLNRLLRHIEPPNPIYVGLSIGGLFAAQAHLAEPRAAGIVLINTLRKPGLRLEWINRTMIELAKTGGGRLLMAANGPMLVGPDFLKTMWQTVYTDEPFEPMAPDDGLFRLMLGSVKTDWDFPYQRLNVPTLVMTGQHDRVFRIDEDVADLLSQIPDHQQIIYPDAGHMIPVEKTDRFTSDLLSFASRV